MKNLALVVEESLMLIYCFFIKKANVRKLEYQTITKEMLAKPAYTDEIDIPDEYWTSTTRKLVKKRRFMENGTVINVTRSPQRRKINTF